MVKSWVRILDNNKISNGNGPEMAWKWPRKRLQNPLLATTGPVVQVQFYFKNTICRHDLSEVKIDDKLVEGVVAGVRVFLDDMKADYIDDRYGTNTK